MPNEALNRTSVGLLREAEAGISRYLDEMERRARIAPNDLTEARRAVLPNLESWLSDPAIDRLSPNLKPALATSIRRGEWEAITNAFIRDVRFGTGGIRALMAFDKTSIVKLAELGLDAPILKGPNTLNNIVVLKAARGVIRYLVEHPGRCARSSPTAVIGFDSRIQGHAFARLVAEVVLAEGAFVYLFDEPVPYPEVTFAIPYLGADVGIFISASHNDYRYNGFKLSGPNGAQISFVERDEILNGYILRLPLAEVQPIDLRTAPRDLLARLIFIGGAAPLAEHDYFGREDSLIDLHAAHGKHVKSFILRDELLRDNSTVGPPLRIAYAAFNGAGRRAVPRILRDLGVKTLHSIAKLDPLDGFFPSFSDTPGYEQQPDPGDPRAAVVALHELESDGVDWSSVDLLIGTDPDADRCGVIVHPPRGHEHLLKSLHSLRYSQRHFLLPADDLWTLILWYRLQHEIDTLGRVSDPESKFVALSHTTSDAIAFLARKHDIGVLKTWVGFGWLSTGIAQAWHWSAESIPNVRRGRRTPGDSRSDLVFYDTTHMRPSSKINIAAMEQSNGFSILGGPPPTLLTNDRSLGTGGHVRDKDGTLAAILAAEIAAYAAHYRTDLPSLLARHIYSDPSIGIFANYYEPDPLDGEYPGIEGDTKKRAIVDRAMALHDRCKAGATTIGPYRVLSSEIYHTGKYDRPDWPHFPDEGIRYYLQDDLNYITVRPSGTTNSMRFHVQLYRGHLPESEAWEGRLRLEAEARNIVQCLREALGAPKRTGEDY